MEHYTESDENKIRKLLLGHRIVRAEKYTRPIKYHGYYTEGVLTLDNDTMIYVVPNEGCGGNCSNGVYSLTKIATTDNIITSVRLSEKTDSKDNTTYNIFVVANAVEINAIQVDGSDGNERYGTGYNLMVIPGAKK